MILGAVMFFHYSWRIWVARQSLNWPSVSGTIVTSTIQVLHYRGTYTPSVRYKYIIDGKTYFNDAITLAHTDPTNLEKAQAKVTQYNSGRTVTVYYNPKSPSDACLEPGNIPWENYKILKESPLL